MGFIAGPYSFSYNSVDLGQTDGLYLFHSFSNEPITGDSLGDTIQDGVYRGGNCFVGINLIEASLDVAGLIACIWPVHATFGTIGQVGRLAKGSSLAKAIQLTAVTGTPAATKPAKINATYAIIRPGMEVAINLAPRLRRIPLVFQLLPYDDSGTTRWFKPSATP